MTLTKKAERARTVWQSSVDALRGSERRRNEIVEQLAAKPANDWDMTAYAAEQARGAALAEVTEVLRQRSVVADRAVLVDDLEKKTKKAEKARAAYLEAHKALDEVQHDQRRIAARSQQFAGLDAAELEKARFDLDVREAEARRKNSETDRLRHETGRARFNAEQALKKFDEEAV